MRKLNKSEVIAQIQRQFGSDANFVVNVILSKTKGIAYMKNVIVIDSQNVGSFLGPVASRYSYTPTLRLRLDELFNTAKRSTNRYFVLDGDTVRAAQSTRTGAESYMQDGYVLVVIQGCGRSTHVEGTNGGAMSCGAKLNGEPYFCAECE